MRNSHEKYHWMGAVDPLYLMCCLVSVCINECSHLSVSGELERKYVCVCFSVTCILVCVCVCEHKASFCLWVWMKTSSSPPVWVWSGCSVGVNVAPVCCNPVVWASHAPSVKEPLPSSLTHTRAGSSRHVHVLLFFNHPFCQLYLLRTAHFYIILVDLVALDSNTDWQISVMMRWYILL